MKLHIQNLPQVESFFLSILAFICVSGVYYSARGPRSYSDFEAQYYPPPKQLLHFTFGYQNVGADILWLRALQDFDYCEKQVSEDTCVAKGWLFHVIDLATDLDPGFIMPHSYGALSLSVLASDVVGSAIIFEKGVARFPNSWILSYWAGYHAIYDENNPGKAAKYLENAARHGAPSWVYSLAARLYTDSGKRELAESLLRDLEGRGFDPELLRRMKKKIFSTETKSNL
jgi:hypothetical protein